MSGKARDVAIVGMACLFPGAPDLRAFWENILAGVDAIGEPPAGSWTHDVTDPESGDNDRLYTKRGGYVGDLVRFDPLAFGVMPKAVDGAEPEQFIALQLARDALADAGYADRPFDRKRTGVIIGRGTYVNRGVISCFQHTIVVDQVLSILRRLHPEHPPEFLRDLRAALKESLPPFNPENSPGLAHSVLVGRIANRLDLMGPAFTVDAACASSMIAVDYGIRDLLNGTCDMVLAGGIQVSTTHPIALLFTQLGALARSGQVRPFHPEADGTLLGEGAGLVVLKRRADAEAAGDRIYAVIRAVGTSSDGKAMGVLAPRVEGEELAMRRAYEAAGVDPATIGLIEAHGTGTPVGDAVEIEALRRIFPDGDGSPRIPLGSVKSMIGHCIPAAAAAGLIKTALAVHHRVLPPTLHADVPNPRFDGSCLYPNLAARPWIHPGPHPRRAGVSAFGFGGINAHVILEEPSPGPSPLRRAQVPATTARSAPEAAEAAAPTPRPPASSPAPLLHARRDSELFLVRGASRDALVARAGGLLDFLRRNPAVAAADVARTLNTAPAEGGDETRLVIVAADAAELQRKLAWALERLRDPACRRIKEISGIYWFAEPLRRAGGLAFLFPGEGAQYQGMLGDLCLHFPEGRAWFDLMDRAFRDHPRGYVPSRFLFPPAAPAKQDRPAQRGTVDGAGRDGAAGGAPDEGSRLYEMAIAIESVFAANQAMLAILSRLGLRPDAVAGHSTGEYSALIAAGAVAIEDEEALLDYILEGNRATERAEARGLVPRGVLLAVGPASPETLRALVATGDGLHVAMDNCPHQAVICGSEEAIARAQADLRSRGVICQRLPFERAYHTPLFAPVCDELRGYYARGRFLKPAVPLYSCATAAPVPDDADEVRRLALEQWARPVRFRETIEAMYAAGIRTFVEVGPRGNLTAFVQDTLKGRPHLAVASNVPSRSGMTQLHRLLGLLLAHGETLALESLYADRGTRALPLELLRSGGALPAPPDRARPLPMNLPALRLEDEFLARHPAPPRTEAAGASPLPTAAPLPRPAPVPSVAAPGAATRADARTAAMQEYLRNMERFLQVQQEVLGAVLGGGAAGTTIAPDAPARISAGAPATPGGLPFAGRLVRREPDGTAVFERRLSADQEIFLRHHTLGGRVSEEASLTALPVLPLAMSLEIMAEAAAAVATGLRPVGMRDVRVQRFVALADGAVDLEIRAVPLSASGEVGVTLGLRPAGGGAALPAVEGTVMMRDRHPEPPVAAAFAPRDPRPARWRPEALYAEGEIHGMFHGPTLQGVAAVESTGEDGAIGRLRALPAAALFLARPEPRFLLDPLTLDVASQVLGYWTAERLEKGFVVFPFGIERLDLYGPALQPPAAADCRVRCSLPAPGRIRADIEVIGPDGRPHLRASGWEVKRIDLPERLYAFRLAPRDVILSAPVPAPAPLRGRVQCCRLDLPLAFLDADGGVWWESLAHFVLGAAEREAWRALGGSARRRDWLLGRIAAKDAVRLHLLATRGVTLFPADIRIGADEHGRPVPGGPALERLGVSLSVSLAHTDGVAMALAAEPARGVGIDIERLGRRVRDFETAAFSAGELALLGPAGGPGRDERALRLWCAKEAVGKALGRGLLGSPRNLQAQAGDAALDRVSLAVAGSLLREFPLLAGSSLTAFVDREGDLIVATALSEPPTA